MGPKPPPSSARLHTRTGCLKCKHRKKKCDEQQPRCGACSRLNFECIWPQSGLPIPQERRNALAADSRPAPDVQWKNDRGALLQGAVSAFINQWNHSDLESNWAGFDCVVLLYPTVSLSLAFSLALEATSLLSISLTNKQQVLDVKRSAMQRYGQALRAINKALADPVERTADHTLAAIQLVCLFEGLAEFPASVTEIIYRHLRGVMTLVKLRGARQFSYAIGRRLFLTAYGLWNVARITVPDHENADILTSLWPWVFQNELGSLAPTYRFIPLADRCVELRSKVIKLLASQLDTTPNREAIEALLKAARALDLTLLNWYENLPQAYAHNDHYWVSFTKNSYRCHRIFLQDMIARCCHVLEDFNPRLYRPQIAACVSTAEALVDTICANMPYEFGDGSTLTITENGKDQATTPRTITIVYHLSFTFPLLVCSMVLLKSPRKYRGIEAARQQCANALGMSRPFRTFQQCLVPPLKEVTEESERSGCILAEDESTFSVPKRTLTQRPKEF